MLLFVVAVHVNFLACILSSERYPGVESILLLLLLLLVETKSELRLFGLKLEVVNNFVFIHRYKRSIKTPQLTSKRASFFTTFHRIITTVSMNNIVNMDPPFSLRRQFVSCRFRFLIYKRTTLDQDQHGPMSQSAGEGFPPPSSPSRDGGPIGVESQQHACPPLNRSPEEHGPTSFGSEGSSRVSLGNEFQDVEAESGAATRPQGPPRRRHRSQASVVPCS